MTSPTETLGQATRDLRRRVWRDVAASLGGLAMAAMIISALLSSGGTPPTPTTPAERVESPSAAPGSN